MFANFPSLKLLETAISYKLKVKVPLKVAYLELTSAF